MSQENDINSIEYLRETYSETKAAPLLYHEDKTTIVTESPKNESPVEKSYCCVATGACCKTCDWNPGCCAELMCEFFLSWLSSR